MTQRRIYQEEYPYFITFRTREGFELFEETKYVRLMVDIIFNAGRLKQYDILAYQIMPDHIHLLVWGAIAGIPRQGSGSPRDTRDGREAKNFSTPTQVSALAVGNPSTPTQVPARLAAARQSGGSAPAVGIHKQYNISQLMYTIKSYFVKELRDNYNILYPIWHKRFYARIVGTDRYLQYVIQYIKQNSMKEKLSNEYQKFPHQYFNWEYINKLS